MIPKFPIEEEPLTISGAARSGRFCESVGPGAAWLGQEEGVFEGWVYPFKILHDLKPFFRLNGKEITGTRVAQEIKISPSSTTIIYSHPLFTARQILFVPRNEPAAVALFEVQTKNKLDLGVTFSADLAPMWPAGLGGQYCLWDQKLNAFLILEASGNYAGLVGFPGSNPRADLIAHEPPKNKLQFSLEINPRESRRHLFPLVVTGSVNGKEEAGRIYRRVLRSIPRLFKEVREHNRQIREDFLTIETPDPQANLAFEWSKIALDRGLVRNPQLGTGLVAGYGISGSSQRPGFGWFFGGDASMNALAMLDYGDFETVRKALEFLIKYQRKDGKIPHEITQSAVLISWFEDYPFAFIHAETTAWFLGAIADYYQRSGDLKFVLRNWIPIKKAFRFLVENDRDRDGLVENQAAGIGAAETGPLRAVPTKVDIFVASLGAWAHQGTVRLAAAAKDTEIENEARLYAQKSVASLERIFFDRRGRPARFALKADGRFVSEETAYPAIVLALRLVNPVAGRGTLDSLSSADLSTPWGVRVLSRRSGYYDAIGYNSGAVWPFLTGFTAWGEANYRRFAAAWKHWISNVRSSFLGARGLSPEVLSGESRRILATAVPHQLFSSSAVITPLVRGILGLDGSATDHWIRLDPYLPPRWRFMRLKNFRVGESRFDFEISRKKGKLEVAVRKYGREKWNLLRSRDLPPGLTSQN